MPQIYGLRILSSWDGNEDAAIFELDEERYGVLTIDFITPVVDDAFTWGQIAAANSISDVFAMGAKPLVALNVVGFPTKFLELEVLKKILAGGLDRVQEAGAFLVGGHSVQDDEPKYGLVVYGEVEKKKLWRTRGARPGDKLILTKPIGTGIAITAMKAGMIENPLTEIEVVESMKRLNKISLPPELHKHVHAATDVTGFGLAGHLADMLSENLGCEIFWDKIPVFTGVKELANMGLIPEGAYRNQAAYEKFIECEEEHRKNFVQADFDMLFDPQTSGGLLLAVDPEFISLFDTFHVIGEFVSRDSPTISIHAPCLPRGRGTACGGGGYY